MTIKYSKNLHSSFSYIIACRIVPHHSSPATNPIIAFARLINAHNIRTIKRRLIYCESHTTNTHMGRVQHHHSCVNAVMMTLAIEKVYTYVNICAFLAYTYNNNKDVGTILPNLYLPNTIHAHKALQTKPNVCISK